VHMCIAVAPLDKAPLDASPLQFARHIAMRPSVHDHMCHLCTNASHLQVFQSIAGEADEIDLNGRKVSSRAYCSW
jgi:hypothetical protein